MDRWVMDDIPELANLTRVVVLTGSESDDDAASALRNGARDRAENLCRRYR